MAQPPPPVFAFPFVNPAGWTLTHGALDWMFPVAMAQDAAWSLKAVGADVTYREISDLSHTYPREVNWPILEWLAGR